LQFLTEEREKAMTRLTCCLLGILTLLAVSHAAPMGRDGAQTRCVHSIRIQALQIANEGPDPMPIPPLRVQG